MFKDWSEFENIRNQVEGKKILIYVHGFNSNLADAVDCAHGMCCGNFVDLVIVFDWPSRGERQGETLIQRYGSDCEAVVQNSLPLQLLLIMTLKEAASVSILGHSMGCRIVKHALDEVSHNARIFASISSANQNKLWNSGNRKSKNAKKLGYKLKHLILKQADLSISDWDFFHQLDFYRDVGVHLICNNSDKPLYLSGKLVNGNDRVGQTERIIEYYRRKGNKMYNFEPNILYNLKVYNLTEKLQVYDIGKNKDAFLQHTYFHDQKFKDVLNGIFKQ